MLFAKVNMLRRIIATVSVVALIWPTFVLPRITEAATPLLIVQNFSSAVGNDITSMTTGLGTIPAPTWAGGDDWSIGSGPAGSGSVARVQGTTDGSSGGTLAFSLENFAEDMKLSFKYRSPNNANFDSTDSLIMDFSLDNGVSWTDFGSINGTQLQTLPTLPSPFAQASFALPTEVEYNNDPFTLRFTAVLGQNSGILQLDDVLLEGIGHPVIQGTIYYDSDSNGTGNEFIDEPVSDQLISLYSVADATDLAGAILVDGMYTGDEDSHTGPTIYDSHALGNPGQYRFRGLDPEELPGGLYMVCQTIQDNAPMGFDWVQFSPDTAAGLEPDLEPANNTNVAIVADPFVAGQFCYTLTIAEPARNFVQPYLYFGLEQVATSPTRQVTGTKFNDVDGDGLQEIGDNGIEDWTIYAVQPAALGSFTLDGNSGAVGGSHDYTFASGQEYIVRVSGTFDAGDAITADAMYSVRAPSATWTDSVQTYETDGPTLLDVQIDGVSPFWGEYTSGHVYFTYLVGDGSVSTLDINDTFPVNNTGSLAVDIYEVAVSTVTDANGDYSLDITGITGDNIHIIEDTSITDWTQTFPGSPDYMYDVPMGLDDVSGYDFGNFEADRVVLPSVCIPGNLVANGGFEAPEVTNPNLWDIFSTGTLGLIWNVFQADGITASTGLEIQAGYSGWLASEGEQFAELDGDHPTQISQTLDTVPGVTYAITFDFSARPETSVDNNAIEVFWEGDSLGTVSALLAASGNTSWSSHAFNVVATGETAMLTFVDRGVSADSLGSFIDNVEVNCDIAPPSATRDVTGTKFNDLNNNGMQDVGEPGIAGWTVYAVDAAPGDSDFQLNSNSEALDGNQSYTFATGADYIVQVSGTFTAGDDITADAIYSVRAPSTVWTDLVQNYESEGEDLLEITIDGATQNWGEYIDGHVYFTIVSGDNDSKTFEVNDIFPSNNLGSLNVAIYQIVDTAVTDANGDYSLDITGITGDNIHIIEDTSITDWTQTFPGSPDYMYDVPMGLDDVSGYDFGNFEADRVVLPSVCIPGNLVANGGFEAPEVTNPNLRDIFSTGTLGLIWNVFQADGITASTGLEIQEDYSNWSPSEGDQFAELDADHPLSISQVLDTVPGVTYDISFDFSPRPGTLAANNAVDVYIGTDLIVPVVASSVGADTTWTTYTISDYLVTTENVTLTLVDRGATSDSLGTFIDNVSVRCDDIPQIGNLNVIVEVVNDEGGTQEADDFTVTVTDGNDTHSVAGSESGIGTTVTGAYNSLLVGDATGYDVIYSRGCDGVMSLGGTAVCIISLEDTEVFTVMRQVIPILACVEDLGDGQFLAHFGYTNSNAGTVYLEAGTFDNRVIGGGLSGGTNHGQPALFLTGTQADAFQVEFTGAIDLTWTLESTDSNTSVPANANSPRCGGSLVDGSLELQVIVIGGDAPTSGFNILLDGDIVTIYNDDAVIVMPPGDYTLFQEPRSGYTATFSGDCAFTSTDNAFGNIASDEDAVCTITNTFSGLPSGGGSSGSSGTNGGGGGSSNNGGGTPPPGTVLGDSDEQDDSGSSDDTDDEEATDDDIVTPPVPVVAGDSDELPRTGVPLAGILALGSALTFLARRKQA